ncbi:Gfo/Idh/MocA family protein [Polynucleobacter sp. Adler-ghost]|uniref:Gfo/Idh/MocA family protein n=1 Tax=Polynucleobacter sp. Adler-ghost TaxID=2770234 RepID=UPI001BFE62E7|nr:Gfo/Idh/MocA family oxidoreductase [Polynucleobacter sp. Adler-ghost]QWE31050.1 Gfo/Idh/MocA family oxidoreductase [Polynucleobacter sp. Adler-ghost]
MNKIKVGIAGYGIVGKRRRKVVDTNSNLKLVAICDRNIQALKPSQNDGVTYHENFDEFLKEDLDAMIICLTNDVAAESTIKAVNRGIHVFCEKPPGKSAQEVLQVMDAERLKPSIKVMYGFNHRYHESIKEGLKIASSNRLGKIINMRGVYGKSKLVTFDQDDWRTKREIAGGGVLLDQGIHMVDLMRLFAGEFDEVYSFIENTHWNYDVEDNVYALMKNKRNGVVAMLNSSATQWRHRFNLEVNFENGGLIFGGILSGSKSYGAETLTIIESDHELDNGDPKEITIKYNKDKSWEEEIHLFSEAIKNNEDIKSGSSLDALNTMKLVNEIYYADDLWRYKYDIRRISI